MSTAVQVQRSREEDGGTGETREGRGILPRSAGM